MMRGIFYNCIAVCRMLCYKGMDISSGGLSMGNRSYIYLCGTCVTYGATSSNYLLVHYTSCYCMIHVRTVARVPHTSSSYMVQ